MLITFRSSTQGIIMDSHFPLIIDKLSKIFSVQNCFKKSYRILMICYSIDRKNLKIKVSSTLFYKLSIFFSEISEYGILFL